MRGVLRTKEERVANDAYYTPEPLARAICERLRAFVREDSYILEPSAGGGAFVHAALRVWPGASVRGEDVANGWNPPGWNAVLFDAVIGNPPYLLAEQHVRDALRRVYHNGHVAFLLRLSFLAGQRRLALYEEHPLRYLIPITPRPSFTPDGKTDASEYAVFVWQRGYRGNAEVLPHLRWTR